MMEDTGSAMERIEKSGVEYIDLEFVDILGTVKACEITVGKMDEVLRDGLWFDGSSIEGFVRICESDMFLKPDMGTYAVVPWGGGKVARVICDVYSSREKPFEGDPRHVLKRALGKLEAKGLSFMVGPELEFFLFKNGSAGGAETHDKAGYFDLGRGDMAAGVRREVATHLQSMGLRVEMNHHEVAPGQHEIDFRYGDALRIADWVMTYKTAVKTVAKNFGLHASFMPKPVFGINGSGMHVHQSLWKEGGNVFHDGGDSYGLSETAKQFIAGQLSHAKALSAIIAPTVNSYKRLVPGYEAPTYICWGRTNRSALVRVPRYGEGKGASSARCEFRAPDPSCNPYLAFAVMLEAGMDGVEKGMDAPEPVEENVYLLGDKALEGKGIPTMPHSLKDAVTELQGDTVLQEALGHHVFERMTAAQLEDWRDYKRQVTCWEMERYFEIT